MSSKNGTRDFPNSPPFKRLACFHVTVISLVVAVGFVWSHDPKSYTGGSFSFWQVLPNQAGQRGGSRQIQPGYIMVESLAAGRRLCSQADTTWCIPAESYYCSGENAVIVGRCCVYQLSNQQPKEISEEIRPVSEWGRVTGNS